MIYLIKVIIIIISIDVMKTRGRLMEFGKKIEESKRRRKEKTKEGREAEVKNINFTIPAYNYQGKDQSFNIMKQQLRCIR